MRQSGDEKPGWPTLHTIAMSFSNTHDFYASRLQNKLSRFCQSGEQLRAIALPKDTWNEVKKNQMLELKMVVEIKDFLVDWPEPFDKEFEF